MAEPIADPRTHDVSFDVRAPKQQASPQARPQAQAGPDRVESRLARAEHKISVIEGHLSALAEVIYGQKH